MDFSTLQQSLALSGDTLTIGTNTLPAPFADFLTRYYRAAGQELVISQATSSVDGARGVVTVTGRGNYLDAANLPVTASFSLDAGGAVLAVVAYDLADPQAPSGVWKLSTVLKTLTGLDKLILRAARIVVASGACTDTPSEVALPSAGSYFIGALVPGSLIGPLAATMDGSTTVTIHGPITLLADDTDIPMPNLATDIAAPIRYPWKLTSPIPGVLLEGKLGVNFKLGSLTLRDTTLRLFVPLSSTWLLIDDIYQPQTAITGTFALPSADITVDATCDCSDDGLVRVEGECSGLTIGNLAKLGDLLGGDVSAALHSSLAGALKPLSSFGLLDVAFVIAAGTGGIDLAWASATVGTQGARWSIWKDVLTVSDIGLRLSAREPFGANRSVGVGVYGKLLVEDTPMTVTASSDSQGFQLAASLDGDATLPLKRLMKTYAPSLTPPSDLTVNRLLLSYATGTSGGLQFGGSLAQAPQAWTIPVGPVPLAVENVMFDLWVPASGNVGGAFRGDILFGKDAKLEFSYVLPGDFAIRATVPKLSLRQLMGQLSNQKVSLPAALDVTLLDSSVLITDSGGSLVFRLGTRVDGMGCFAFEARKLGGAWGFAAGFDLGAASASSVPGLSALAALEKLLHLQKFMLVASSFDDSGFQFPDLAQLQNPRIGSDKLSLPGAGGVTAGLNVFAEWALDSSDKTQSLLRKLLGLGGTLQAVIQVGEDPAKNSRLGVAYDTKIQGHPFDCMVGVQLTNGQPSFYLTGTLTVNIQGQPQTFAVTTLFVPGGALLSANMTGSTPVDCKLFKLSNLGLLVGVDWAGLPSLGVTATIDVKEFESSIAVFFDSADPSRSLVAGSVSSLTLKDVVDTLAGKVASSSVDAVLSTISIKGTDQFTIANVADALDGLDAARISAAFADAKVKIPAASSQLLVSTAQKGALWHLTDLTTLRHYQLKKSGDAIAVSLDPQFYFAPQQTAIGTIKFPQGFFLDAALSLAGFDVGAKIEVSANQGISVDAQMDKISLVDDKLFSIAAMQGGGGPRLSLSTFAQPSNPVAQFRQPHFYVNGALTLLGIKEGIYASVSTQGVDLALTGELVPGVQFDVDARFGKGGLGAAGSAKVGIGTVDLGSLGKAKINTRLDVSVEVEIDSRPKSVSINTGATFAPNATVLQNELTKLVFQGDGNLVLYRQSGTDWDPLWASGTHGANQLAFQKDGNLVLYAPGNHPVWASNTAGRNAARMVLQDDLNLVIYDGAGKPLWASNTDGLVAFVALESSFEFAGAHYHIARFKLSAAPDTFTKLVDTMYRKVEDALLDDYKDATKWVNAVKRGAIDGVSDSTKVLTDYYHKSSKEASDLVNAGTKAVDSAVDTTEHTANKVIKKIKFW